MVKLGKRRSKTGPVKTGRAGRVAAVPLGQRIRRDIEARIRSGVWAPGHRIPYEHELMQKYGCARMTVSKALASLAENGLIERRRRAGSFVRGLRNETAVLEVPDIRAEIVGRGCMYGYTCLTSRKRKTTVTEFKKDNLPVGTPMLAVTCLHLADGKPYAYEERRILLDTVPCANDIDFQSEPPGPWLLRHIAWHEAEHRISAMAATPELISLLNLEAGSACLKLERATWMAGRMLTSASFWYPATDQKLVARFTPLKRPRPPVRSL